MLSKDLATLVTFPITETKYSTKAAYREKEVLLYFGSWFMGTQSVLLVKSWL